MSRSIKSPFGVFRVVLIITATALASASAQAEGWSGEGELGYSASTGNSETSSLIARLGLGLESGKWRHALDLEAINAQEDEATTAERYAAEYQADYSFREHTWAFGNLRYDKDRFGGFEHQISETVGIGHRFVDRPNLTINGEAGAGAKQTSIEDDESSSEFVTRLGGDLSWGITDNTQFTQELLVELAGDNTYTEAASGLKVAMNDQLALKLSFTLKNNSDVPDDNEKTDTYTAVTLVYGF